MTNWLTALSTWVISLVKSILGFLFDLVGDLFVSILSAVLGGLADLFSGLSVPAILQSNNFGSILSPLPPFALYVISYCHLPEAFTILAAGVSFRLLRKVFTLFQW